jgi:hypothetical protein
MQIMLLDVFIGVKVCGNTECDELESIVHNILVAMELDSEELIEERVKTWNELFRMHSIEFGSSSKEATILLFSAYLELTNVLEDPLGYYFARTV